MARRIRIAPVLAVVLLLGSLAPVFAAEPETSAPAEPSKDNREKMAAIHEKMAECLRSSRPFAECRSEMRKSCHDRMGESGCPMMADDMGMGMGMGRGHGMGPGMGRGGPPAEKPKQ